MWSISVNVPGALEKNAFYVVMLVIYTFWLGTMG